MAKAPFSPAPPPTTRAPFCADCSGCTSWQATERETKVTKENVYYFGPLLRPLKFPKLPFISNLFSFAAAILSFLLCVLLPYEGLFDKQVPSSFSSFSHRSKTILLFSSKFKITFLKLALLAKHFSEKRTVKKLKLFPFFLCSVYYIGDDATPSVVILETHRGQFRARSDQALSFFQKNCLKVHFLKIFAQFHVYF